MDLFTIAVAFVIAALVVVVVASRRGPASAADSTRKGAAADEAVALREERAARKRARRAAATGRPEAEHEVEASGGEEPEAWDPAVVPAAAEADSVVAAEDSTPSEAPAQAVAEDAHAADEQEVTPEIAAARPAPHAEAPGRPRPPAPAATNAKRREVCPTCGSAMALRVAKRGPREGRAFMACTRYPTCRTAFEVEAVDGSAR